MIESVALTAPISPPLTGASSIVPPFSAISPARRRVATGEMLLMSITSDPRCRPASTPSLPAITCSTSGVSGTMVMITVDCAAASRGDAARRAPSLTRASTAAWLRL
jgi:hypothetical protein